MARSESGRTHKNHLYGALQEANDALDEMRSSQERYGNGLRYQNEANVKRGLRKFTDAHRNLLNATYSAGDYMTQLVTRAYLRSNVDALLAEPNVAFHRSLRDSTDHSERLSFSYSFDVNQIISIAPSAVSPTPNLIDAMMRGAAKAESTGSLGKIYLTYGKQHLQVNDGVLLDGVIAAHGFPESPPVIRMAELCYERLLSFATATEKQGGFRPPAAS